MAKTYNFSLKWRNFAKYSHTVCVWECWATIQWQRLNELIETFTWELKTCWKKNRSKKPLNCTSTFANIFHDSGKRQRRRRQSKLFVALKLLNFDWLQLIVPWNLSGLRNQLNFQLKATCFEQRNCALDIFMKTPI